MITEISAGLALPLNRVPAQVDSICLLPARIYHLSHEAGAKKVHLHSQCLSASVWTSTVNKAKRFWGEILVCEPDTVPPPLFCGSCLCWAVSAVETAIFWICLTSSSAAFPGELGMLKVGQELPWLCSSLPLGAQGSCSSPKLTIPIYKYYATYSMSLLSEFEAVFVFKPFNLIV